jgi:Na+/phosphate symporter
MITMSTPLIPPGQVTAADLLAETTAIRRDVAHLLVKVEVIDARDNAHATQLADHEVRLRTVERQIPEQLVARLASIERWQWRAGGVVAALAAVSGLLGSLLGSLIAHAH